MNKFAVLITLLLFTQSASAATWAVGTATTASWADNASWVSNSPPSGADPTAVFPVPTAASGTRNMDLNANWTLSSVTFGGTGSSSVTQNIRNSTNGTDVWTLTFDAPGAGPAVVNVIGNAATNSRMQSDMLFTDDVDFVVDNTVGNATAGALSVTGNITGPGALIKDGLGELTTAFNAGSTTQVKQYTGATIINNGRWRHSTGGAPSLTSGVTVNNGGQIDFITGGTLTYGANSDVPLNLNGFGPTAGPFAAFPGAFRPDSNLLINLTNKVVLQSNAMIHNNGATAVMNIQNVVSGPGALVAGAATHDANVGKIVLQGANTYTGGTIVNVGTLAADGTSTNAFGTGNVQVISANTAFAGSQAHVLITAAATNAINDLATLSLAGGATPGVADDGFIDLDFGINETVGGLILGGVTQSTAGTYGSVASGAMFQNDEYFAGGGLITLTPAGLAGDYNGDGKVDAADYVLWRKNPGAHGGDPAGYTTWRNNFGLPGSGSGMSSTGVPEPSTLMLLALVFAAAFTISRR